MKKMLWHKGVISPVSEARICADDRGFSLADGVFDTLLWCDGRPVWERWHYERLVRHAQVIRLEMPLPLEAWQQAIRALVQAASGSGENISEKVYGATQRKGVHDESASPSDVRDGEEGRAYAIRTTLTRGRGGRGVGLPPCEAPDVWIQATPVTSGISPTGKLWISRWHRDRLSPLSRIKSLGLLPAVMARREAVEAGCDDAVLPNHQGASTCCTTGNLFAVCEGAVWTPPVEDGVMDGTTRRWLLAKLEGWGIPVQVATLEIERLFAAEAIWSTNCIVGVRPFSSVHMEGQSWSCEPSHPWLLRCLEAWTQLLSS